MKQKGVQVEHEIDIHGRKGANSVGMAVKEYLVTDAISAIFPRESHSL